MPRFAIIIPACNEAEALPITLEKLRQVLDPAEFAIAVGANGCTDATAELACGLGAIVGETAERGYGHGCRAAIDAVTAVRPEVEAYVFFAADGANDARDISRLVTVYKEGCPFVLGQRTRLLENWSRMTALHVLANRVLGLWCGLLAGRFYCDLGPLRILSRSLFEGLQMRECTYGWTIEPQILAARLGIPTREIDVTENPRIAGEQKVSHVSWRRTLQVGGQILAAGWRARRRSLPIPVESCRPSLHPPLSTKDFPNPV